MSTYILSCLLSIYIYWLFPFNKCYNFLLWLISLWYFIISLLYNTLLQLLVTLPKTSNPLYDIKAANTVEQSLLISSNNCDIPNINLLSNNKHTIDTTSITSDGDKKSEAFSNSSIINDLEQSQCFLIDQTLICLCLFALSTRKYSLVIDITRYSNDV